MFALLFLGEIVFHLLKTSPYTVFVAVACVGIIQDGLGCGLELIGLQVSSSLFQDQVANIQNRHKGTGSLCYFFTIFVTIIVCVIRYWKTRFC